MLIWAIIIFFAVAGLVWICQFMYDIMSTETRAVFGQVFGFFALLAMLLFGIWGIGQLFKYGVRGGFDIFMSILSVIVFIVIPSTMLYRKISRHNEQDK